MAGQRTFRTSESCHDRGRAKVGGIPGRADDRPAQPGHRAGGGFIYVAPDYLGLGDSTVPRHRYFHAATEASSAADLLGASREVLTSLRVHRSGELFTFGFSQGGHAAMALHRVLDHRRVDVTATATVAGPSTSSASSCRRSRTRPR